MPQSTTASVVDPDPLPRGGWTNHTDRLVTTVTVGTLAGLLLLVGLISAFHFQWRWILFMIALPAFGLLVAVMLWAASALGYQTARLQGEAELSNHERWTWSGHWIFKCVLAELVSFVVAAHGFVVSPVRGHGLDFWLLSSGAPIAVAACITRSVPGWVVNAAPTLTRQVAKRWGLTPLSAVMLCLLVPSLVLNLILLQVQGLRTAGGANRWLLSVVAGSLYGLGTVWYQRRVQQGYRQSIDAARSADDGDDDPGTNGPDGPDGDPGDGGSSGPLVDTNDDGVPDSPRVPPTAPSPPAGPGTPSYGSPPPAGTSFLEQALGATGPVTGVPRSRAVSLPRWPDTTSPAGS